MHVLCGCGARYHAPAHLAGKRLKCRKCGGAVEVPASAEPTADHVTDDDLLTSLAAGSAVPQKRPPRVEEAPSNEKRNAPVRRIGFKQGDTTSSEGRVAARAGGTIVGYLASIRASFLLPFDFLNLLTLGVLSVSLTAGRFLPYAGCLGIAGMIVIWGYFAAFMLNVVRDAAAGQDEITQPDLSEGFGSSLFLPAVEYAFAQGIGLLPALLFAGARIWSGAWDTGEDRSIQFAIYHAPPAELALLLGLVLAGLLMWPMCLLVVAVSGGMAGVFRLDLILRTIARTPAAYVVVVLCAYSSQLVLWLGGWLQEQLFEQPTLATVAGLFLFQDLVFVYATFVAMRAAGLYYHHFKARFAWSWG